ncbi:MAG: peroxide stress protein YaaA [Pseudomonadota bacterium]
MPNVIAVLSPAKRLDAETPAPVDTHSQPAFLDQAKALVKEARRLRPEDLSQMMHISEDLAKLNHQRFKDFTGSFDLSNAKQAIHMFKGDVYVGLDADSLSADGLAYAQEHIRILSGLYGLLRPLDLMQPYRLEMGTGFATKKAKNLYGFWGDTLTDALKDALDGGTLVNLASNEYFSAVDGKAVDRLITPQFKEYRDGKARIISFFAKKARGQMARFMIDHQVDDAQGLKDFKVDGYGFDAALSNGSTWVFSRADTREAKAA